jgi:hypothetical protein
LSPTEDKVNTDPESVKVPAAKNLEEIEFSDQAPPIEPVKETNKPSAFSSIEEVPDTNPYRK